MLFLTLLALEGMARIAYYAAYGPGYGSGRPDAPLTSESPPPPEFPEPFLIRHPFYGYTRGSPAHDLNELPRRRREDTVIIGLLGGSVARDVQPFLERALHHYFAANDLPRWPVILDLSTDGTKQPQQTLIVADTLLRGGEFDLIINLDGLNETAASVGWNYFEGNVFPFFPLWWNNRAGLTAKELLLSGRIGVLRREQARLTQDAAASPLRRSAVFGLANRWRQERAAAEIIRLNHELAATESAYNLERYGPGSWLEEELALLQEAARVWYRSSVMMARLAELGGADYYHFLQPNQYVPGAKPLSAKELRIAYNPLLSDKSSVEKGYPLLRAFALTLQSQGINYFDLTGIFANHPETLYRDTCCHLNDRGNELLAAAMVRRMEPALPRLGQESPAAPGSALAAARPPLPDELLVDSYFRVYLQDSKRLRYVREDCDPADTAARFFLHLTPRDLAALPPHRREHDYDNRDFSFAEVDGRLWRGQCQVLLRLPDYSIAYLRTGQYVPYAGELWFGEFSFPE